MRCAYLAQDRVDFSEAVQSLSQAVFTTESRTRDAIETSGEVLEGSAKKKI